MSYCDHWLFQYEKNCVGYRLLAEHGWSGMAGIAIGVVVLLLIASLLRRTAKG
ncbi:hypothetical protein SHLA_4c002130 [Shinella sp. DD12]|nr:hypothetical protein SHLA_4c002130 [Shinella sp. DD12]